MTLRATEEFLTQLWWKAAARKSNTQWQVLLPDFIVSSSFPSKTYNIILRALTL